MCVWKDCAIQMSTYSFILDNDNEILVMLSKCILHKLDDFIDFQVYLSVSRITARKDKVARGA
jgi:hypothetical protein